MKNLKDMVIEKLVITKDTKLKIQHDRNFFCKCNLEDITSGYLTDQTTNEAQAKFDEMYKFGFYLCRYLPKNLKNPKTQLNTLWFAVYCYLCAEGPKKQKDIVQFLKPGTNNQFAEEFTAMRKANIIKSGTGPQRGLCIPQPIDDWIS